MATQIAGPKEWLPASATNGELIFPLKVGDMRVFEFAASETLGIQRVVKVVPDSPLGLGYSIEPISGGRRRFVYDEDMHRNANGVITVMDAM